MPSPPSGPEGLICFVLRVWSNVLYGLCLVSPSPTLLVCFRVGPGGLCRLCLVSPPPALRIYLSFCDDKINLLHSHAYCILKVGIAEFRFVWAELGMQSIRCGTPGLIRKMKPRGAIGIAAVSIDAAGGRSLL